MLDEKESQRHSTNTNHQSQIRFDGYHSKFNFPYDVDTRNLTNVVVDMQKKTTQKRFGRTFFRSAQRVTGKISIHSFLETHKTTTAAPIFQFINITTTTIL